MNDLIESHLQLFPTNFLKNVLTDLYDFLIIDYWMDLISKNVYFQPISLKT